MIGERAGSGIPKIVDIWHTEGFKVPTIEEQFDPDRTIIILSLEKKQAIKTSDKTSSDPITKTSKTFKHEVRILEYLKDNGRSSCNELSAHLGLSPARTRAILSQMTKIESIGENRNKSKAIQIDYFSFSQQDSTFQKSSIAKNN